MASAEGTVACLAEALLWVGGSVALCPQWQLVERCLSAMQAGTQMVKLRGASKGLARFYHLDEHRSCLRWRPSRKNEKAKISIDSIQEVSEGLQAEVFQRYPGGSFDPSCCFSICHGEHRASLDLVAASGDEARTWVTGLRYLLAGIRDEDSLARRQRTRDQWLKQTFDEADKNGDGSLSMGEVLQLLHKLNVNLPRRRVKQMFREADTDDRQGTLGFGEFCAFYKAMSTRRDLYLLLLSYGDHKDHLDAAGLQRFLEVEQKMTGVTLESCRDIIEQFEPCPENRRRGVLGIDGFTNYARSPAGDIFNPLHLAVHQDMTRPLSHYFITSSHNTYLVGDQLTSQSRADMYARVLQAGCRCVEVDCWDGADGEPIVHHGYTLTSKILFKDVIETINRYAFVKNEYPVILSIENHCSVVQQKKMAQYLTDILGDKLDLSSVSTEDATTLPSPQMLKGKVLVKGKKLPATISEDAEEGEVSDEDSADEMDDDCKLLNGDTSSRKRMESVAKRRLDSLIKESKARDCEDPDDFAVSTLPSPGRLRPRADGRKSKAEDDADSGEDAGASRRSSRRLVSSFSRRKKKASKLKRAASVEEGDERPEPQGSQSRGVTLQKKTMKLSRALSDLVKYTKSVGTHDVEMETACSWQVSSFSETRAQQILQQKAAGYLRFNQRQLSRIYPSSYRVDSSNYNPQPFWNAGCQMVALNYQTEGRVLQLNRAKFSANGNCGYVLKPPCMCQGVFNPNSEDPLPGQLRKQLVLRVISGQQLPKPRDSVLGDRGEIIDPFVEVEVIGLPVDCNKEQTRVVDDNGFNPMWEETLVFVVHMPEVALIRFLVWDHDPIGRDFIGQRTLAFSSLMPGYRHVYLEGMEEASIFVHVALSDISGKVKQALGLKGLFLRGPKPGSLDSPAAGRLPARPSVSQRLLRRTASAPSKTQKPGCAGSPELPGSQDAGVQGAADHAVAVGPGPAAPPQEGPGGGGGSPRGKAPALAALRSPAQGAPPRAPAGPGPAGVAATCMKCVAGSCAGVDPEGLHRGRPPSPGPPAAISQQPRARADSPGAPRGSGARQQGQGGRRRGGSSASSSSSSPDSRGSPEAAPRRPPGALQREMNALFVQKLEEMRSEAPGLSTDACTFSTRSLETIAEEPAPGPPPPAVPSACRASPPGTALEAPTPPQHRTGVCGDRGAPPAGRQQAGSGRTPGEACAGTAGSPPGGEGSLAPVREVRREGRGPPEPPGRRLPPAAPAPAVRSDATGSDQLWQRLEPGSHRDSVSSSSSLSSSDTVIDLSLPGLGLGRSHDSLAGAPARHPAPRPCSAAHLDLHPVPKSKSNPNLQAAGRLPSAPDQPQPRAPRPSWGRLSLGGLPDCPAAAKSKSLGDLTAADFGPGLESRAHGLGPGAPRWDALTEQLRQLTGFQQAGDIMSPTCLGPAGAAPSALRRSSSRSQSRVRAIASRARQVQERQRPWQALGTRGPHEERGTPEGACSVGREGCTEAASADRLLLLRL